MLYSSGQWPMELSAQAGSIIKTRGTSIPHAYSPCNLVTSCEYSDRPDIFGERRCVYKLSGLLIGVRRFLHTTSWVWGMCVYKFSKPILNLTNSKI